MTNIEEDDQNLTYPFYEIYYWMDDIDNATINLAREASSYQDTCRIKNNPLDYLPVRLSLLLMYLAVFTVAVSGNCLVVYVVLKSRKMQTVTNIFITNLALSDLMVNFTSLWLTPMYTYVGHWIWGGWLCHGLPLFQGTSIFISTMTLTAIAVDRYYVIVHHSSTLNINDRMSMRTCILIVTMIWLLSLSLIMPYALHMNLSYVNAPCNFWVCIEHWANVKIKSIFGMIVMALQFVVPFVVIGFSYQSIWSFLNARRFAQERASETIRKKRLLRMLVIMVVIFAVCWFPFNLLNIIRDLHWEGWLKPYFSFLFLIVHLVSMTATCWNPILYAWMNESFRYEFVRAIPLLRQQMPSKGRVRMVTDCIPANRRRVTGNEQTDSPLSEEMPFTKPQKGFFQRVRSAISLRSGEPTTTTSLMESRINTVVMEDNHSHDTYLL